MIIPLPRWAMVAIPVVIVAMVADLFLTDGQLIQYCLGWPLKMVGQLVLKYGLVLLPLLAFIYFNYRRLAGR